MKFILLRRAAGLSADFSGGQWCVRPQENSLSDAERHSPEQCARLIREIAPVHAPTHIMAHLPDGLALIHGAVTTVDPDQLQFWMELAASDASPVTLPQHFATPITAACDGIGPEPL